MAEDDVRLEVEAVQAVYVDDCRLLCYFPPHLTVHMKPRTADDSSQQFVESTIGIKASNKYPEEPPHIYITDMKGMDDGRLAHLILAYKKGPRNSLHTRCLLRFVSVANRTLKRNLIFKSMRFSD